MTTQSTARSLAARRVRAHQHGARRGVFRRAHRRDLRPAGCRRVEDASCFSKAAPLMRAARRHAGAARPIRTRVTGCWDSSVITWPRASGTKPSPPLKAPGNRPDRSGRRAAGGVGRSPRASETALGSRRDWSSRISRSSTTRSPAATARSRRCRMKTSSSASTRSACSRITAPPRRLRGIANVGVSSVVAGYLFDEAEAALATCCGSTRSLRGN